MPGHDGFVRVRVFSYDNYTKVLDDVHPSHHGWFYFVATCKIFIEVFDDVNNQI